MAVMAKRNTKSEPAPEEPGEGWVTRSIRFPPTLYSRIEEEAKRDRRSTQLQVIWLIEEAFRKLDEAE